MSVYQVATKTQRHKENSINKQVFNITNLLNKMIKKTLEQYQQEFDTIYEEWNAEKFEEYEQLANECIADFPEEETGYIALGKMFQKMAFHENPITETTKAKIKKYSQLAELNKNYIKTSFNILDCYGWVPYAVELYDVLFRKISPDYAIVYDAMGMKFLYNCDYKGAAEEFANVWRCDKNYKCDTSYEIFKYGGYLNSPIEKFHVIKYHCIEDLEIKDDISNCKEIYFLGENGVGKTLLLQSIIEMVGNSPDMNEIGILKIDRFEDPQRKNYLNMFAYGTARFRAGSEKDDFFDKTGYDTLFDRNSLLMHPIYFFEKLRFKELEKESPLKIDNVLRVFEEIIDFDNTRSFKIIRNGTNFSFKEKGTPIEFEHLAEGYRSVLIWLCDLLSRLIENEPHIDNLDDFYGIVLIDEIDMFLHPKWEYSIVKKLRKKLPNIQWFLTTHSPMLILGASEDAVVYKLYKDNEGKTKISEQWTMDDLSHLMANAIITSPLFDMPTARMSSLSNKERLDSSDNFWIAKIYERIKQQVENDKTAPIYSPKEIDDFVNQIITEIDKEAGV